MNMVIKCLLAALWLLAVPWAAGGVVLCKSKKSSMGMNLLAGYLMMFSFAEILALAAIWAKLPLHVLKYSLAAVMASAAVLGIVLALVKRNGFTGNGEKTGKMSFYFVVAAILILLQLVAASFWLIWMRMTLFMWQQLQHLSIRIPFFPLIRIPDIPIHDYQAGMFCRRFRYFLQ